MAKEKEIKYDGSLDEMMRLGLVDESGTEINTRRNEINDYMNKVWLKQHPTEHKHEKRDFPKKDPLDEYFEERAQKKAERRAKVGRILGVFSRKSRNK